MLTVISVNFNNAPATILLLRSLERQSRSDFHIIVIDNDSAEYDRTALLEYAATSQLKLEVISSELNRGFSGGNNLGIRKALAQGSKWTVLLNNDTTVPENWLAELAPTLERYRPGVYALPLDEGQGRIARAGIVQWLRPTLPHLYGKGKSQETVYAIGGAMAVHRDVWEKAGLMDERFFLYFEDAEYSMRAREHGFPVETLGTPPVRHAVAGSTSRLGSPLLLRYHARNSLLFNYLRGPWWVRLALPLATIYGIIFQFAKILLMPSRRVPSKAIAAGIVDFYAKRFGKIAPAHQDRY